MTYRPSDVSTSRKVFVLRIWQHKGAADGWIGEVQDVNSGQITHIYGLEALFDFLRQKIVAGQQEKNDQADG